MITVENLSFTYRKSKRAVLRDFSLSFESGRVYGLLGKNGAGKSTLLYLMSGLLTPKNGKVMFHDTDVRRRHLRPIMCHPWFGRILFLFGRLTTSPDYP